MLRIPNPLSSVSGTNGSTSSVLKSAVIVSGMVVMMSFASNVSDKRSGEDNGSITSDLVKQAMQWLDAALQDTDPLTRWQHLSYAKAYMNVCRHIASDAAIERASRTHVRAIVKRIDKELQITTASIHKSCHKLRPQIKLPKTQHLPGDEDAEQEEGRAAKRATWI